MTIESRQFPQFFATNTAQCPYLPDCDERKVFTHLAGADAVGLHDTLTKAGFRRSQNIAYRPACENCCACISIRIPVDKFIWTKSFRKIWRKNADLDGEVIDAVATSEQYSLFSDYVAARHGDGGMAEMTALDYASMVNESAVETKVIEYRKHQQDRFEKDDRPGELIGVALSDILEDGLSMIYSFFDTDQAKRSLGTFFILDHIERAQKLGLPYVYLGYWVEGSPKMAYKARFLPQERLEESGWQFFSG